MARDKTTASMFKEVLIACVGGSILFAMVIGVQAWMRKTASVDNVAFLRRGMDLSALRTKVLGANAGQRTLIIATSTSCPFSRGSLKFHRQLLAKALSDGLTVMVVVPNSASAEWAQQGLNVPTKNVLVTDLHSLGIRGTPTVVALDQANRIQNLWEGSLPSEYREVVYSQIASTLHVLTTPDTSEIVELTASDGEKQSGISKQTQVSIPPSRRSEPTNSSPDTNAGKSEQINDSELASRLQKTNLLDISPRNLFRNDNKQTETYIPYDELAVRARYEIPKSSNLIVNCSQVDPSQCDMAGYILQKAGAGTVLMLDRGATGVFCQTTSTK